VKALPFTLTSTNCTAPYASFSYPTELGFSLPTELEFELLFGFALLFRAVRCILAMPGIALRAGTLHIIEPFVTGTAEISSLSLIKHFRPSAAGTVVSSPDIEIVILNPPSSATPSG
jgi:hypothetical protein